MVPGWTISKYTIDIEIALPGVRVTTSTTGSTTETGALEPLRLSAFSKSWRFPVEKDISNEVLEAATGHPIIARILMRRGFDTVEAIKSFLDTSSYTPTSPMELPDMDRAVVRINQAIVQKEHITVYGDYDVDGITGTAVLLTVLKRLGASVDYYIPSRSSEGYGLNLKAVSILASKHKTKLIITCDCGVSNFAEVNFAKQLGVDTLILDHHTMPELLPPAAGIVHPKRIKDENHPLYHLPGVGVAYKTCEALLIDKGLDSEVPLLLDFVTLGMIADLVPLVRENRYLVKVGLPALLNSVRPGIKALLAQVRKSEDTDVVGFGLAPRINAVGRLADARAAVELMTTDDSSVADNLAKQLQVENTKRQELCERIFAEADRMITNKLDLERDRAIAIYDAGWHHGVVGIVASRLVEKFHKPVFIGELDQSEGIVKGSARGVEGIDLYEVLKANEHLLSRWGGHKMAAGFSVEAAKAQALCRGLTDTCNKMLAGKPSNPSLEIDTLVAGGEVSTDLAKELAILAPFGIGNKKPLLCMQNLVCKSTRGLGKEGKHHRLMLQSPAVDSEFECVLWNSRGKVPFDGQEIDLVFSPEINVYNGRERLQLVVSDWRSSKDDGKYAAEVYERPSTVAPAHDAPSPVLSKQVAQHLERLAKTVASKPEFADELEVASDTDNIKRLKSVTRQNWKDLRGHTQPEDVVSRAIEKFGAQVAIFGESASTIANVTFDDRTSVEDKAHLIFWQFPPSAKVFQEIVTRSSAQSVYLVGADQSDCDDPAGFLKRLFGIIRFAVNKRDGQVHGDKLAAAMAASKMSVALGLTIFRRMNLVDWFTEDGCIYLDLLGNAVGNAEDLPEYRQFVNSLDSAKEFRSWCTTNPVQDIQLAVMPNRVGLGPQIEHALFAAQDMRSDEGDDNRDGQDEQVGGSFESTP